MTGIYQIQSIIKPERIYIGSAINIIQRWRVHLSNLKKNKHSSKKLQNHYNKYGQRDLQFSVLYQCKKENLINIEQCFINAHNPYFNICKIAGNTLGLKYSKKINKKKGHKGNQHNLGKHWIISEKSRQNMRKPKSNEHRLKLIGNKNACNGKGILRSKETKEKMKESWKKRECNPRFKGRFIKKIG